MRYIILILFLVNCSVRKPKSEFQVLNFGYFEISAPSHWKYKKVKGVDSYVGQIMADSGVTLHFDLGWYSNKLTYELRYDETLPGIEARRLNKDTLLYTEEGTEYYVYYDTVGGYRAKVVTPKQPGVGITGIYIDSLWRSGSDIDKFNLYGRDFGEKTTKDFFTAIKTLKFHEK